MDSELQEHAAQRRATITLQHVGDSASTVRHDVEASPCAVERPYPKRVPSSATGGKKLKWNGWGFADTGFALNENGDIVLTGNSYDMSGKVFPDFRPWLEKTLEGIDVEEYNPPQRNIKLPKAIRNENFIKDVEGQFAKISFDRMECLHHGHGHTAQDIFNLHFGTFHRIPDVVIWPGSHEQVEAIVQAAVKNDVCVIPFGGGTTVTEALECPEEEKRMIVSLDMKEMNRILWVDRASMMACFEAGCTGKDLERRLTMMGLTLGHEPDSMEFSSVGGWVATRASGMKKNRYGNIEDLLVHVRMVTAKGTLEKSVQVPRISNGPDMHDIILGSEGTLGVITEATFKVRYLPEARAFGAVGFPDFESGVKFMREVALRRCQPASVRLMDNLQMKLGQCLRPENNSQLHKIGTTLKEAYIEKWLGWDEDKMAAATLCFEGTPSEVAQQQKDVYSIAKKYGGVYAGEESGRRGYFMTYMIAYLRDFGYDYWLIGESFETSVPWSNVETLIERVKSRIVQTGEEMNLPFKAMASARVTQVYDTGACVYFYFGFVYRGVKDPVRAFSEMEARARDEVLACGGSLSHHHGVGKLRKQWMKETVGDVGISTMHAIKKHLDPKNTFGNRNLID